MRIIKYGGKKFASKQAREERELLFPFVCIVFQCKSNENGQERRREARRATEELERINEAKPRAARMATVKNAARAQVRGAQPESGEKWSPHKERIVAKMGETSRANERRPLLVHVTRDGQFTLLHHCHCRQHWSSARRVVSEWCMQRQPAAMNCPGC